MIIYKKKYFNQEQIDISHLSPSEQKKIISNERKKIELDRKISDTAKSFFENKKRSSLSISDNAKIGENKIQQSPLANTASSTASFVAGSVASDKITNFAASSLGLDPIAAKTAGFLSRTVVSTVVPKLKNTVGKVGGVLKGLTADFSARQNIKRINRLAKKREKLDNNNISTL